MLGGEGKYQKRSPRKGRLTNRSGFGALLARSRSLAWVIVLPAAATVTTDIWFPPLDAFGYDVLLAVLNVSGAFLDGFFFAWETGGAKPSGPKTEALHLVAERFRSLFLSTYTSWAGMVGFAASFAHANSSVLSGVIYILICISCAFVAHGLGRDLAKRISAAEANTSYNCASKAHMLVERFFFGLIIYIVVSYGLLENDHVNVEGMGEDFVVYETPKNRIFVSMIFAICGAYTGNVVGDAVDNLLKNPSIPMGTLICNAVFALLGLALNAMRLSGASWARSVILQSFSSNFCGAASAFAGHAKDNRELYSRKRGVVRAGINVTANVLFALMVFWIALEIEELLEGTRETSKTEQLKVDSN